jgi:hypothetical protein
MFDLAKRAPLVDLGDAAQPYAIRANNTGRLASNFLGSFFSEDQ